jgi:hypothetical protein
MKAPPLAHRQYAEILESAAAWQCEVHHIQLLPLNFQFSTSDTTGRASLFSQTYLWGAGLTFYQVT